MKVFARVCNLYLDLSAFIRVHLWKIQLVEQILSESLDSRCKAALIGCIMLKEHLFFTEVGYEYEPAVAAND